MTTIKTEKLGYLEFNRPAEGYIFDGERRCFAKVPSEIKSLTDFFNKLTSLEILGEAVYWYEHLDWQAEKEILNDPL